MAKETGKQSQIAENNRLLQRITAKHVSVRRIVLITVLVLMLLFIFGQSALPERVSAGESGWFRIHIMTPLFGLFGLQPPPHETVRKLAHVFEYAVFSALSVFYFRGKPFKSISAGFLIAFLDESFQMLTARGAQISDVWIDLIGIVLGAAFGVLIRKIVIKHQLRKQINVSDAID